MSLSASFLHLSKVRQCRTNMESFVIQGYSFIREICFHSTGILAKRYTFSPRISSTSMLRNKRAAIHFAAISHMTPWRNYVIFVIFVTIIFTHNFGRSIWCVTGMVLLFVCTQISLQRKTTVSSKKNDILHVPAYIQ